MGNNFKRFLSLLLAFVMVVGLMPMSHAHAEGEIVKSLGEKVTSVEAGTEYAICIAGTINALTNEQGSSAWGTHTLATATVSGEIQEKSIWTLETVEGGFKVKNVNGYLNISRNTASLNETGHVFELAYTDAGWTIKSLDTSEYGNNLGDSGSIGGWSGDGTKFDIYTIAEKSMDEIDPWGKRNWVKVSVDTETVFNESEGLFEYAWDRNPGTIWHSDWKGGTDKLDGTNTFAGVIDFGKAYTISQFSFTPRLNNPSGQITQASLYVKETEEAEWILVAEHATFEANGDKKDINFESQAVRFVKFVAEQSSDGWVAVSEFDINYIAPACEHTPAEAVVENEVAATCTEAGSYDSVVYCSECGEEISREAVAVAKLGHEYQVVEVVAPTCNKSGYTIYGCIRCDKTYKDDPTEPEHQWDEGTVTAPTCAELGYTTYTCTVCGFEYVDEASWTPIVDHAAGEAVRENEIPATCTEAGSYESATYCVYCGMEMSRETMTIDALGHNYENGTCTNCGDKLPAVAEKITGITGEGSSVDTSEPAHDKSVANAFDGNTNTFWATVPGTLADAYLIADLGGDFIISQVNYTKRYDSGAKWNCTGNLLDYVIEVSVDGETWNQVAAGATVDGTTEITFDAVAARYVKLTATRSYHWQDSSANTVMCVAEFEVYGYAKVVEHTHTPAEAVRENEVPATCTEAGSYESVVYCSECGEEISRKTVDVDALGHNYENGTCTNCGEKDPSVSEIPALILGDNEFELPESQSGEGYTGTWTAEADGTLTVHLTSIYYHDDFMSEILGMYWLEVPVENALPENYYGLFVNSERYSNEDGIVTVEVEAGDTVTIMVGNYYGYVSKAVVNLSFAVPHEHSYEAVVTAPTCTAAGYTTYTCECGESYTADETAALGHTEQTLPAVDATFDNSGLTEGTKCSVCQEVLTAQETIPALDYNEGTVPTSALTATAGDVDNHGAAKEGPAAFVLDGDFTTLWHTDWYGTSRANHWIQFEISGDYLVNGLRYKPRTDLNREGNPQLNGTITEYKIQVSYDGVNFTDIATGEWDANQNWKTVEFEAQDAAFVRLVAVNACTDNDSVFASAAEIRLIGEETEHIHAFASVETAPTCTEAGYTTFTCRCGYSYVGDEVAALGHTEVVVPAVDATCTETGLTEGKKCSVCQEILVAQEEIPALGHSYENGICTECGDMLNPFTDVPEGSFYYEPVLWAVANGVTTGATATTFNPNGNCQRAAVVTFLWRAAGSPEPATTANPFTDVKESDFFYKAVLWAVEEGVTNGISADKFGPFELCNRAQVVTFLWRAMGKPDSSAEVSFADVQAGQFYSTAVAWAVENGITNGISATEFGVNGICNRAQVVTFLYRTYIG